MFSFLKSLLSNKESDPHMWLLVGLGNPGDKYKNNRHNIGFMVMDEIVRSFSLPAFKSKFQSEMSEGRIDGQKVVILKPQTYMNESGQAVGKAAKFYKIAPDRICVFHDELDLEPSKLRIKDGGGTAGHNGLKSIKAHLGTADFKRVRMGIGHPGDKNRVSGYVLSDFAKAEQDWVARTVEAAADHVSLLLDGKDDEYMTRIAQNLK